VILWFAADCGKKKMEGGELKVESGKYFAIFFRPPTPGWILCLECVES